MGAKLTTTEKIIRAFGRAEEAACELLGVAERFKNEDHISSYNTQCRREALFRMARKYSRAMEALTRIRK